MLSWSWLWCQIDKKWVLGSCRCPPKTTKSTLVVKPGGLVPRSQGDTYRGDACGVSASERSDRRVWAVVGRVWGEFKDLGVCSRVGAVGCRDNSGAWGLRCALHRGRDGARPELSPVKEWLSLALVQTGRRLVFCVLDHVCVSSCSATATGRPCLVLMFCEIVIWTGRCQRQVTEPGQRTDVGHCSALSRRRDIAWYSWWKYGPGKSKPDPDRLRRMSEPKMQPLRLPFLPPHSGSARLAVPGL